MATHSDTHTPPATTPALHVLAISGSTRAGSLNAQLLRAAAAALPPSIELVELDPALIKAIPAFDEDDEAHAGGDDIPALRPMRDQIAGADAVLFATPEYNASIPGALKNALDWISRPIAANVLRNKPVASSAPRQGSSAPPGPKTNCGRSSRPSAPKSSTANWHSRKPTSSSTSAVHCSQPTCTSSSSHISTNSWTPPRHFA
jgi:NADPH-dependent FMN reductase